MRDLLSPLSDPAVRRLQLGGAVSAYGDALQAAAQAWLVVQLTRSTHGVGLFALAWLLPRGLGSLIAGVLIDRHRRTTVLKASVVTGTLLASVFVLLVAAGVLGFHALLALALGFAVLSPFEVGARNALLPTLVPRDRLPAIIRLNFLVMYTAELLGLVTGGLMLGATGILGCVLVNLTTYVAYLVFIAPLRSPAVARGHTPLSRAFVDGLRYILGKRKALVPLAIGASFAILGFHFDRSTLPLFALEDLQASARVYGLLLAAAPLGAVLFLALAREGGARDLAARVIATALMLALCLGSLALCERPLVAFVLLLVLGAAKGIHYSSIWTLLSMKVPDVLRGRVFSFYNLVGGLHGVGGLSMAWLAPSLGHWVVGRARGLSGLHDPHGLRGMLVVAALATALAALAWIRPLRRISVHTSYLHTEEVDLRALAARVAPVDAGERAS